VLYVDSLAAQQAKPEAAISSLPHSFAQRKGGVPGELVRWGLAWGIALRATAFIAALASTFNLQRASASICLSLATGNWQLATGNWQLATGNWQLATGNWQLATGNWQLATGKTVASQT
jgi:hypothetical protein